MRNRTAPTASNRRAVPGRAFTAVAITTLTLLSACSSDDGNSGDANSPRNERSPQAAPKFTGEAALDLSVASTPAGARMTVAVTAPADATEMQVGVDPSFTTTDWEPVSDEVRLDTDGGYQEVFARFRSGADDADPEVVVAGLDVDLAAKAATSDTPTPTLIGLSSPTTLTVDVEVGRIRRGLEKEGDELVGSDVDAEDLDTGWELDAASGAAPTIADVERTTRPIDTGHSGDDGQDTSFPVRHRIALTLSEPLTIGTEYELTSPLGDTSTFTIDDRSSRSPAVHANQVGFRPGDVAKQAYLTAPPGDRSFTTSPVFHVVDTADDTSVFDGVATKRETSADGEIGRGDLTGLDVWALDFSAVSAPGRYRVCVERIGCSESLSVDEDSTWLRAATSIARGLYHQRSGIALGEPTTSIDRPRPDHPDDGLVVHQSTLTSLEAADLTDDKLFEQLVAGATDEVVDGAWGGHFDAGDWDRRSQHLWMVREVLDLVRVAPDRFASLDLNIPESGDAVPDVLDEAFWTLDLFARLQRADGAVRGGVESARFPDFGTPSWKDDLARYAYAPDAWTTYMYASAAADAAVALRTIDPERSARYADSATRAMTWAEAQDVPSKYADKINYQRAVAAASMLGLTGDATWNQVFLDTTPFAAGPTGVLGCNANEICDSGWNYLWVDRQLTDPAVVANIEESFRQAATRSADASDSTLFGWCLEDPDVPLVWGLGVGGVPHAMTLLRAYVIDRDPRFLAAAQRCASVTLGGNPLDVSYVTGLGANPARHPLIVDVNTGQLPVWPGTPVYGNHQLGGDTEWVIQYRLDPAGVTGDPYAVPYLQNWYDLADVGPMNEFTVYQSHGPALWVFGVLASASPVSPDR